MSKPLYFSAFVMNTASHVLHGLWRDPSAHNHEFNSLRHWTSLATTVEKAGYDLLFFADVFGLRAPWNGNWRKAVEGGIQVPVNDPSVLASALATVTETLGIVFTSSIVQDHPFNFARRMSSLDHYTEGRLGWNIVTSFNENMFRSFGHDGTLGHDERYEWAYEYLDVVFKLWEGSWDESALVQDKARGVHSDPAKIHRINHVGKRYRVEGPHFTSPSPQRTPVLFQAGASPAGQLFSARNAEGVYISSPNPAAAHALTSETRALAVENGRDPADITFAQGLSFVIGDTHREAVRRNDEIKRYLDLEGVALHALGDAGVDAGRFPLETPLSELGEFTGVQGFARWAAEASGNAEPTIRDLAWVLEGANRVVGTAEEIADLLEEWREAGVDGINVYHATVPGTFTEVADRLFPTLRERGLIATDKSGTLRHKLLGRGDRLPDNHPAAAYRGAFGDNTLLDPADEPVSAAR
ncbi:LLM class flavin-dependent oxidoreductase [Mycolicibacterium litorale]|uniref:Monooxygenase n=1 Tax=Mycolicibacterium litorale TaxID=758802 RepID=A0AAD1II17_9MYCO|nr:LLM class flavin-dependent oxidoreductase [Mycolicibacterium litorale]MCV7413737.1 LLM class flavin-dependent oxidoreductase [Mycolicibacterium litorale]TDY03380.1 FMN-dependent oxidoreductase (nitrilotriacetate monooxygenase family) [Mycolicibacterium litorale]BBY15176.1 monooxygenase [Mycolicibacterium litorale]